MIASVIRPKKFLKLSEVTNFSQSPQSSQPRNVLSQTPPMVYTPLTPLESYYFHLHYDFFTGRVNTTGPLLCSSISSPCPTSRFLCNQTQATYLSRQAKKEENVEGNEDNLPEEDLAITTVWLSATKTNLLAPNKPIMSSRKECMKSFVRWFPIPIIVNQETWCLSGIPYKKNSTKSLLNLSRWKHCGKRAGIPIQRKSWYNYFVNELLLLLCIFLIMVNGMWSFSDAGTLATLSQSVFSLHFFRFFHC